MEQYKLLEENINFVAETPVLIPLRWRTKTRAAYYCRGKFTAYNPSGILNHPLAGESSIVYGSWNDGGANQTLTKFARVDNSLTGNYYDHYGSVYRVPDGFEFTAIFGGDIPAIWLYHVDIEVDWQYTMNILNSVYSKTNYVISTVKLADSGGNVYESGDPVAMNNLLNIDRINSFYKASAPDYGTLFDNDSFQVDLTTLNKSDATIQISTLSDDYTVSDSIRIASGVTFPGFFSDGFQESVNNVLASTVNLTAITSVEIPVYLKVYVVEPAAGGSGAAIDTIAVDEEPRDEDPEERDTTASNTASSGVGASGGQGLNNVSVSSGNQILNFNSVYLTGEDLNNFVSAGGGIISEGGVYPQGDDLYISDITLDIEGSTMNIVEFVKFDATPSFSEGDKVFGYILDENNVDKPVFTGYVMSKRRILNSGKQEIVYECKDLKYYLNQYSSPSNYVYTPSEDSTDTKTYDRVLKEILNIAGIPQASINLPSIESPAVSWIYTPVNEILEWATKYFGKYVYYIDRYGRLVVKATDSGSVVRSFAIPTEGTSITDNYKIMGFEPITDYSRARSRIVLAGDFELTEKIWASTLLPNAADVNPSSITSTTLGSYTYTVNGTSFKAYYFLFVPKGTLNDKLISDPGTSATITLISKSAPNNKNVLIYNVPKEMPITQFLDQINNSKIYSEDLFWYSYNNWISLEVKYCLKSEAPIRAVVDTSYPGGVEVVNRTDFKKITATTGNIDDTVLMQAYANQLAEFYKPTYGGQLTLDGLYPDIALLDKLNITGSSLPSVESDGLACYSIHFDVVNRITTIDLSNKVYYDLPYFDVERERARSNNETITKVNQLEINSSYAKNR